MNRGYTIRLEPDKYPKHAELEAKLRKHPQWELQEPQEATTEEPPQTDETTSETILPHQAKVVEELRRKHLSSNTEHES